MPANDEWWWRQYIEAMKEASKLFADFKEASQPNLDHLDQALAIYEECCQAYDLHEITFEAFIECGNGLRTRQAHTTNDLKGL